MRIGKLCIIRQSFNQWGFSSYSTTYFLFVGPFVITWLRNYKPSLEEDKQNS